MQFDDEYPAGELFISSASLTITGFVIYKKKVCGTNFDNSPISASLSLKEPLRRYFNINGRMVRGTGFEPANPYGTGP